MEMRQDWAIRTGSADLKEKVGENTAGWNYLRTILGCHRRDALGTCKDARMLILPIYFYIFSLYALEESWVYSSNL